MPGRARHPRPAGAVRGDRPRAASAAASCSYASDLDVIFVFDGTGASAFGEADRVATGLLRFIGGPTPAGPHLRDRRVAPTRGQAGVDGAQPRGLPLLLGSLRARLGAPGDAAGPSPGRRPRPRTAPARRAGPPHLGRADRRGHPRDPPHEGPHRARAHARRRGPRVPPQARSGLAVGHRVHRAAAAAPPRRRLHRHERSDRATGRAPTRSTRRRRASCSRPTGSASRPGTAGTS